MSYDHGKVLVSLSNILLLGLFMQVSGATRMTRWWTPTGGGENIDAGAGLCSLAIAPRGYQCEEHQVGYIGRKNDNTFVLN